MKLFATFVISTVLASPILKEIHSQINAIVDEALGVENVVDDITDDDNFAINDASLDQTSLDRIAKLETEMAELSKQMDQYDQAAWDELMSIFTSDDELDESTIDAIENLTDSEWAEFFDVINSEVNQLTKGDLENLTDEEIDDLIEKLTDDLESDQLWIIYRFFRLLLFTVKINHF